VVPPNGRTGSLVAHLHRRREGISNLPSMLAGDSDQPDPLSYLTLDQPSFGRLACPQRRCMLLIAKWTFGLGPFADLRRGRGIFVFDGRAIAADR